MKEKRDIGDILKESIEVNKKKGERKIISKKSAREILKDSNIKNKLKECFKKCSLGRIQLKKCVVNAMDAGLSKANILAISNDMTTGFLHDEASLCAIVAIGQALRYEEKHEKSEPVLIPDKEREKIENKLRGCFKKCSLAKRQLRKCIVNALDAGLTKEEVLAVSDDIVGGFGKDEVSLCAILAVSQALIYEENIRAKPIDVVKERSLERGDF